MTRPTRTTEQHTPEPAAQATGAHDAMIEAAALLPDAKLLEVLARRGVSTRRLADGSIKCVLKLRPSTAPKRRTRRPRAPAEPRLADALAEAKRAASPGATGSQRDD